MHSPGVSGWGVNISEDARHWLGLLQYNPSTVGGLERIFPFLDLFLHLFLRKSFYYGVRREISNMLRIFSASTSLLFRWFSTSFVIISRLDI